MRWRSDTGKDNYFFLSALEAIDSRYLNIPHGGAEPVPEEALQQPPLRLVRGDNAHT